MILHLNSTTRQMTLFEFEFFIGAHTKYNKTHKRETEIRVIHLEDAHIVILFSSFFHLSSCPEFDFQESTLNAMKNQ